ncbi:pyridoxal phosphate phosphatase PHOSPHO2-like [Watersipora subatra]|uniref:pyridoxal phosphate phosphatase PHOSPHO2-like n=1 Tax=Watersipora subatra TaxID=2589382 RepID=UPI00355B79CD
METPKPKTLMIFDFDHTLVNGNSNVEIQRFQTIPFTKEIRELCRSGQNYMGVIYSILHDKGVTPEEMKARILTISLLPGMKELFTYLSSDKYEVIIVSDANTVFIEWILTEYGIRQQVRDIYSNPAEFNSDGKLIMKHYHYQNSCDLSSPNMCKGDIVDKHVRKRQLEGVEYTRLCYVGDGGNDYCPSLRLSSKDYVFVRADYDLENMINENPGELKAKVILWSSGRAILDTLKTFDA